MLRVLRYTDKQFRIVGWTCVFLEQDFFMFCFMLRELFCVVVIHVSLYQTSHISTIIFPSVCATKLIY